ncbi:hypothetical protein FS837_003081 [Tulasnella sp. UAMH 9824]|nr:hypothetical protein FS837_003081 [Tulasnella sp. UAMH 9824]
MDKMLGQPRTGTRPESIFPLDGWSKLPLELISYIIELSLPGTPLSKARMEALYSTRMVSRMWRDTVDSTPSLWNVVSSDLPLQVNSTAIQKSGCSPLDVYVIEEGSHSRQGSGLAELLELATREIGRWSTVTLWFTLFDVHSLHLTSPAPLLRDLTVVSESRERAPTPVTLFGGIAPKLEALEVDGLPVDWTSSFIHGLRKLSISNLNREQMSTQQVLDVFVSAPLLEHFYLADSTLDHHPSLHIRPTMIQVPGLKTIELHGINTEVTRAILSSIRVPNCVDLAILDPADNATSTPSFPEPALSLTLSANNISSIDFFDYKIEWVCRPTSLSCLEFDLEIPYDALTVGVEWVMNVVGSGTEELVHKMEVRLEHDSLSDGDLAAYYAFSRCQSVTKLTLACNHVLARPILELLRNRGASGGGEGRLPPFPGLEILVLASEDWALTDLEVSTCRRFGELGDGVSQEIPKLSIVLDTSYYRDYGVRSKPDLAQLQRLRMAKGVESLTRKLAGHQPGMLAVVYRDDTQLVL